VSLLVCTCVISDERPRHLDLGMRNPSARRVTHGISAQQSRREEDLVCSQVGQNEFLKCQLRVGRELHCSRCYHCVRLSRACFETRSCYVAQAALEFMSYCLRYKNYRHVPPFPACLFLLLLLLFFFFFFFLLYWGLNSGLCPCFAYFGDRILL
jgi:hypothetical protein